MKKLLSSLLGILAACTTATPATPPIARTQIEGDIFTFMTEVDGPRVQGAVLTILELPGVTTTTGADGHFVLADLPVGQEVTLVMQHPDYYPLQTATFKLGASGIRPFALQALPLSLFTTMAGLFLDLEKDKHCIIATTVARLGGTLHVHLRQGESGVQAQLTPKTADTVGPVYFGENVLPDPGLQASTKDGGLLFYNVLPGDYVLSATKAQAVFAPLQLKCRAGYLVNAGPPMSLQSHVVTPDWGAQLTGAGDSVADAGDALCDKTANCVEAKDGPGRYPAATTASCKGVFRRAIKWLDADCAAQKGLKSAWAALLTCRAASCDTALGGDSTCATEDAAFVAAADAYGACYAGKHL